MEDINYKGIDRKAIFDYLSSQGGEIKVADVITNSGANRLRVYPILFELQMEGKLEVVQASELGTPVTVRLL